MEVSRSSPSTVNRLLVVSSEESFVISITVECVVTMAGSATANVGNASRSIPFDVLNLGAFSGDRSDAFGINDAGQVVGTSLVLGVGGAPNTWRAFEYSGGTMNELDLGGAYSIAWDINNAGQVVGELSHSSEGGVDAFLYQDGRMQDLGNLGGNLTSAMSINERGDIVGYGTTGPGDTVHGFIYIDGQLIDVNTLLVAPDGWQITRASAINEGRQIVSLACRIDSQYDCMYALLSPVPEPAAPLLWSGGLLLLASRWVLRRSSGCRP